MLLKAVRNGLGQAIILADFVSRPRKLQRRGPGRGRAGAAEPVALPVPRLSVLREDTPRHAPAEPADEPRTP